LVPSGQGIQKDHERGYKRKTSFEAPYMIFSVDEIKPILTSSLSNALARIIKQLWLYISSLLPQLTGVEDATWSAE
jgi:hypothetical protein